MSNENVEYRRMPKGSRIQILPFEKLLIELRRLKLLSWTDA